MVSADIKTPIVIVCVCVCVCVCVRVCVSECEKTPKHKQHKVWYHTTETTKVTHPLKMLKFLTDLVTHWPNKLARNAD
jgi:hypothetical protein